MNEVRRPSKLSIGDEVPWQGRARRIEQLVSICVALEGIDGVVCLPVDATTIETFKDEKKHRKPQRAAPKRTRGKK